eukprot:g77565.t1
MPNSNLLSVDPSSIPNSNLLSLFYNTLLKPRSIADSNLLSLCYTDGQCNCVACPVGRESLTILPVMRHCYSHVWKGEFDDSACDETLL